MNNIETPITRRQAITGIVAAGTSLAGCSSVTDGLDSDSSDSTNSTTDEELQRDEISDPLNVAETNLEATFEILNGITIIEDDAIIYADTGQDPDFLDIYDKMDEVKAALETASEEDAADTTRYTRVELGFTLAEQKLTSYLLTARVSRPSRKGRVFRRSVGTEDRTGRE